MSQFPARVYDPFPPLEAALSGKAFTLVNHSIRFGKPFTLWAIFAGIGERVSGFEYSSRLSHGLAA